MNKEMQCLILDLQPYSIASNSKYFLWLMEMMNWLEDRYSRCSMLPFKKKDCGLFTRTSWWGLASLDIPVLFPRKSLDRISIELQHSSPVISEHSTQNYSEISKRKISEINMGAITKQPMMWQYVFLFYSKRILK